MISEMVFLNIIFFGFFITLIWSFVSSSGFGNLSQLLTVIVSFVAIYYTINEMKKQRIVTENTLNEMRQQQEDSYRPHLVIPHIELYRVKLNWFKPTNDFKELYFNSISTEDNNCNIEILNIGMGPAKTIKITWDYDYKEILRKIEDNIPDIQNKLYLDVIIEAYYKGESINFFEQSGQHREYPVYNSHIIPYILPSKEQRNPIQVPIPNAFLLLMSFYGSFFFNLPIPDYTVDECGEELLDYDYIFQSKLKTVKITLEYYDIGNKVHRSQYLLDFMLEYQTEVGNDGNEIYVDKYIVNVQNL